MYQSAHTAWLGSRLSSLDKTAVADAVHRSLASPMSSKLRQLAHAEDWGAVISMEIDPRDYSCPKAYFRDAIPVSLFKKAVDLPVDAVSRKTATFRKWMEAERVCYETNQRLYRFLPGKVHHLPEDSAIARHIAGVRKIIKSWIGETPSSEIELGFSPGSTLSERGQRATAAHKLHKSPSSTHQYDSFGYRHFVGTLWCHNMVDAGMRPSLVAGGEYFTVPKTAKVERTAELQPTLNIAVQLGYGRLLRKRLLANTGLRPDITLLNGGVIPLKGLGWDITKAQGIHREVARRASVDQSFCTIDLSSASDSIAKVLVEALLPENWYRQLDSIRTHRISISGPARGEDGGGEMTVLLEKFSSMGNGFTFELETILFAAVACYVTRRSGFWGELGFDVFVYGDDIIVRDELYSDVTSFLRFLGFSVNVKKSFHGSHPFRESCGGDFFLGQNVRPTNIEKTNELSVSEVVTIVNKVKHCSERLEAFSPYSLNQLWFNLLQVLPRGVSVVRGPDWLGDSVVYDPMEGRWITRDIDGRREIRTLEFNRSHGWIPWFKFDPATILVTAILGFGDGVQGIMPRNVVPRARLTWTTLCCTPF